MESQTPKLILRKVPEITAVFWVVKLLTTALGESVSDFLVVHVNPYLAVGLGAVGFGIALSLQFSAKRYITWIYWLAVAMVAIFGTMAADAIHIQLGVPYWVSTIFFLVVLCGVFLTWKRFEDTLSIHSIKTRRREIFYWATVSATFALGTAAGDLTAIGFGLGYLAAGMVFAVLIAIPALAYRLLHLNEVLTFWLAYVLTRPLGASFADWTGKPHVAGGLGIGDLPVSAVLVGLIAVFIAYMTLSRREAEREGIS